MKERILTWLKNTVVILIASLMLLGVIPLGMISLYSTANAQGEFLRLYPETETALAGKMEGAKEQIPVTEDGHLVGENRFGYLRFDLGELGKKDAEEIQSASLRLVFNGISEKGKIPIQLWLMPTDDWSKSMKWEEKPSRVGEVLVAASTVSAERDGAPCLYQVDLTEYLRKWMEEGREKVSFRIDGLGQETAVFAGTSHEDPLYRPCLKVVAGEAEDPDEKTLEKASVVKTYATNPRDKSVAVIGEREELYLKFNLNANNIKGGIYQANLTMDCRYKDSDASLRIEQVEDAQWPEGKEQEPAGERRLVYREEDSHADWYEKINLTEAIKQAYQDGKEEITFVLGCDEGEIAFDISPKQISMDVAVSDDRYTYAMTEAVENILGDNPNRNEISESLLHDHIAENGIRATVVWDAIDLNTGNSVKDILSAGGKIRPPRWFREECNIAAKATVSAGEKEMELLYYLTVLPQEIPDFSDSVFGTMLDLGNKTAEKKGRTEVMGTTIHSRWVEGRKMLCRKIARDEMVIAHLDVDGEKQNYLTVKIWEEDDFSGIQVLDLNNRTGTAIEIREPTMAEKDESGFLYLTYPIPIAYTKGKDHISFRITKMETELPEEETEPAREAEEDTSKIQAEENSVEEEPEEENLSEAETIPEEIPAVSLYSLYLTQTPYFDPMDFADQGEPIIKKEETEESEISQFLTKVFQITKSGLEFRESNNSEDSVSITRNNSVYVDSKSAGRTTLIFGKEEQLLTELSPAGEGARIYRDTPYYNAYAEMPVQSYAEGDLHGVDYGIYRIFKNQGKKNQKIPYQEENLAGLYQNLADEQYYSFLQKGQMLDDSVLNEETPVLPGSELMVKPEETLVLQKVAEPLKYADFRVSNLNGQTVTDLKLTEPLEIASVTFRVMGTVPEEEKELTIICGVYDRGLLVDFETKFFTVSPGEVAWEILLPKAINLQPGQTLKVFTEDRNADVKKMTPILELPQKQ